MDLVILRVLNCNPSANLEREFADKSSEAAAEGSAAHALCEHKLRKALKQRSTRPTSKYDSDEMEMYTDSYLEFVLEQIEIAKQHCADPFVLIEQRLDFSCYVPDGFGTGDCLIVADKLLHIIDFKYGLGVLVDADENPQMMLYALGALRLFDALYDIDTISMSIFQPRRQNVSTWTITVAELEEWAEQTLRPKAELAFKGEGEFNPGPWCTFCKAAVKCRARAEEKLALAQYEFAKPPLLTDEEIEDILSRLDDLTKWANEIAAYAQDAAINHGKHQDHRRHQRSCGCRHQGNAQSAIDEYSAAHPGSFSEEEHREFGALLKERAAALSEATGLNIHSIVDDG